MKNTTMPRPSELMRRTAEYVATNDISYDELAHGPLGQALTHAQMEALADDDDAVNELVDQIRAAANRMEARGD